MISFDSLPQNAPQSEPTLIPRGKYKCTITEASMKVPKTDANKPPYLNLVWDVFDDNGKKLGKLFDIITESESDYMRYKLKCFIDAIDVNVGRSFELKDLTKVSVGKSCMVAINIDSRDEDNKRNQVNIFDANMYEKIDNGFMPLPENDVPFDQTEQVNSAEAY